MTLPIASTTITVTREARPATEDPYGDGYDDPGDDDTSTSTPASGVRAVIAPGGGSLRKTRAARPRRSTRR